MVNSNSTVELDSEVIGADARHSVERRSGGERLKSAAPDLAFNRYRSCISTRSAKLWLERGLSIGRFLRHAQKRLNHWMDRH